MAPWIAQFFNNFNECSVIAVKCESEPIKLNKTNINEFLNVYKCSGNYGKIKSIYRKNDSMNNLHYEILKGIHKKYPNNIRYLIE
jgi:hypothetical protein